jgi:hypothetical protein
LLPYLVVKPLMFEKAIGAATGWYTGMVFVAQGALIVIMFFFASTNPALFPRIQELRDLINPPSLEGVSRTVRLAGSYDVAGIQPDGTRYQSTLHIRQRRYSYEAVWEDAAGQRRTGVGIAQGDTLAVSVGARNKNCTIAVYEVQPDGSLEGRWRIGNADALRDEQAIPAEPSAMSSITGVYTATGTQSNTGDRYRIRLVIEQQGKGYSVQWFTQDGSQLTSEGTGLLQDNILAVGWNGGLACGVALYQIQSEPQTTLHGMWIMDEQTEIGIEQAVRR